jgi:hypothetical protein
MYDGYLDVWASDPGDATERAKDKLHRTSFPDRWRSDFIIDSIEVIGQ